MKASYINQYYDYIIKMHIYTKMIKIEQHYNIRDSTSLRANSPRIFNFKYFLKILNEFFFSSSLISLILFHSLTPGYSNLHILTSSSVNTRETIFRFVRPPSYVVVNFFNFGKILLPQFR